MAMAKPAKPTRRTSSRRKLDDAFLDIDHLPASDDGALRDLERVAARQRDDEPLPFVIESKCRPLAPR